MNEEKPMLGPAQKKWVAALRSGEYKQGNARLQTGDKFCCLGVACKVAEQNGVEVDTDYNVLRGATLLFQPATIKWLGLKSRAGEPDSRHKEKGFGSLVALNDSGKTFEEIADTLENNPEVYFKGYK